MSLHKIPLTDLEKEGLLQHGLPTETPSQLSDVFRAGMKYLATSISNKKGEEAALLKTLTDSYYALQELGWNPIIYCPKDGSIFHVIEAGSTGIHDCSYSGTWPTGTWQVGDGFDSGPSRPILWKPKKPEETTSESNR